MVRKENLNSICHCEESMATKQSDEIASHSFAKTEESERSTTSTCHPCESGDLMRLLTTLVPYGTACWRRLWLPVKRGMTEHGRFTTFLSSLGKRSATRGSIKNKALHTAGFPLSLRSAGMTPCAESGRTLVETLGTLAIMGILSVVGLAAYNSAMDRHKANTLIQEAQRRAVIVAGQIGFQGREPSLTEFEPYNKTSAGEFKGVTTEGLYKQFGIKVSKVSKSVCENILRTIGESTPIRRLSLETTPTSPLTTCNDTNAFLFIYNNDMQGKSSDTEYATDDSSCKSVCGVFNPETHTCDESDCEIPTNTCTENTDCNTNNECMVCDTEKNMCKNGCQRVQYLESTGTQYIDTGILPSGDLRTKVVQAFTGDSIARNSSILGSNGTSHNRYWINYDNHFEIGYGTYLATNVVVQPDEVNTIDFNYIKNDSHYFSFNGTEYMKVGTPNTQYSIVLFGRVVSTQTPDLTPQRIYKVQFIRNDVLLGDFIPVIAPNGKACMFNKVKEDGKLKLYCDANGGTFKTNKDN